MYSWFEKPRKTILVNCSEGKEYYLLIIPILFLLLQIISLDAYGGQLGEGWFSDAAYHLDYGWMAKDIPFGASWSAHFGKIFLLIHHYYYKLFGVGLFQARMVTFISGIFLLVLLFSWTSKYVSKKVAILATFLLALSPLYYLSLPDARYDVMHCLFAFLAFYFISSAVLDKNNYYFFIAGLLSAISIDIGYRGIEIVLAVFLFNCIFCKRENFLERSSLIFIGAVTYLPIWFILNVIPIGIDNFIAHNLLFTADFIRGGGTTQRLFSEVSRFFINLHGGRCAFFMGGEVLSLSFLTLVFLKYKIDYNKITKVVLSWLIICFILMTIIESTTYLAHLLIYYPLIYILSGIGLYELFRHNRRIAYLVLILILFFAVILRGYYFIQYFDHAYIKRDFNLKAYYGKLRSAIDLNENIIGSTNLWYAFPDSQYYGGTFYLDRVKTVLKELKPAKEYENNNERARALLSVFEKRKIRYVIANKWLKATLLDYFPDKRLRSKHFVLVDTIYDRFNGNDDLSFDPFYKTEIYKIISY